MQQTNLDTDRSTHAGMEGQSRPSHRHLLLQVWCSLLTVSVVVMAAFLTSIKPKSSEDGVSTFPTDKPTANPTASPFVGSSLSYIQLIKSLANDSWEVTPEYKHCSLLLRNNSLYCTEESVYFIYAQVTFSKHSKKNQDKHVILQKNKRPGKSARSLVEGTFPSTTEGSVWVAKIVRLQKGDSVSLNITDDCLKDNTLWGAFQLH